MGWPRLQPLLETHADLTCRQQRYRPALLWPGVCPRHFLLHMILWPGCEGCLLEQLGYCHIYHLLWLYCPPWVWVLGCLQRPLHWECWKWPLPQVLVLELVLVLILVACSVLRAQRK